jgi:ketosteroid isomerase-like protein
MKPLCALVLLATALPGLVRASTALESVLAADAAFAADSLERGQQAAFLAWLAVDGVVFRPRAVVARDWLATHEQASGQLQWSPAAGAVGCSGRLAVTTGPWSYRNSASDDAAAGHYLSVWRLDADGEWRVLLDHGIGYEPDARPPVSLRSAFTALWPGQSGKRCSRGGRAKGLADADADLNVAIRSVGLAPALRQSASSNALAYRDDFPPDALVETDWPTDRAFAAGSEVRTLFVGVEEQSDLGYSYGDIAAPAAASVVPVARAVFVRIWQREGRRWRVALDMLTALVEEEEP